ncbi:MAG: hypothetical protein ABIP79_14465 [Chitinophagaceae bacterium]
MDTPKDLASFEKRLSQLKETMKLLSTDEKDPIFDGPVESELYFNSSIKILWILKEGYDNENNGKGGFDYSKYLSQDNVYENFLEGERYRATWYPIIFVSFGILNNFAKYNEISFIENDNSVADVIHNVAVININKLAGGSSSNHTEISKKFHANKELLLQQIEVLQPDIIIGGGTLSYFYPLLKLNEKTHKETLAGLEYYYDDKKIFINAKHPSHRLKGKENFVSETYVDDIIEVCRVHFLK